MLQLKDIKKTYGSADNIVEALKGVSLNFRSSEFVSILGPSGCGKTTLLNIIGGLDRYTSGDLVINGKSTKDYKDKDWDTYRNHEIGFVFQSYNLIPHQTILGNVELALTISGVSRKERRERAIAALEKVGLKSQINKRPNQLSGGQMQRVAIARALVNNPNIILADEPTGALDTDTSVQVMDILKEVAQDRLVIMVTHNPDLAERYSSRIIRILDGNIIGDSDAYEPTEEEVEQDKVKSLNQKDSKMSFATSFKLSLQNMMTKKGKTTMVSIAGSIGIIGIALVLSISNGFTNYIDNMQSEMLGNYPITVSQYSVDYDAIMDAQSPTGSGDDLVEYPSDPVINVYDPSAAYSSLGHLNMLTKEYADYVEEYYQKDLEKSSSKQTLNAVSYSYSGVINVATKTSEGVSFMQTSSGSSMMSLFMGTSSSVFQEGLDNKEFVDSCYDVIYGKYPSNYDEVALVVDSKNRLSVSTLESLNIPCTYTTDEDGNKVYDKILFDDLFDSSKYEIKAIYNDSYYIEDTDALSNKIYVPAGDHYENDSDLETYYDGLTSDNAITLKVVGVLRIDEDCSYGCYNDGMVYLSSLTDHIRENAKTSQITTAQNEEFAKDSTDDMYCYGDYSSAVSSFPAAVQALYKYRLPLKYLLSSYQSVSGETADSDGNYPKTEAYVKELVLQKIGSSDVPSAIYIYPKAFNTKSAITSYLDDWNKDTTHNKIIYTDAASTLTSSLGTMVNIISYVLIAFAAISLVVSSVMIGIITYTSVIERTKEIGVLRALGARKKDISAVFNSETLIIGFFAGLIGIVISYILCIPINALILSLAQGAVTTNIAVLNPLHALILVVISVVLTSISGLIPSRFAAKKDPVVALRTE